MTDPEILKLLASLGIDELSYKALPLLPLLQVAWADGEIQAEERELVEAALKKWSDSREAERLARNWLTFRPTSTYFEKGRTALIALAARNGELKLERDVLSDVLSLSREVAQAAGGLWGLGSISREEKAALAEIAQALKVAEGQGWKDEVERTLAAEPPRQRVRIKFNTTTLDLGRMPGILSPVASPDIQIPVEGTMVIGSDPTADVVIDDTSVPKKVCEVRSEKLGFYVRDLGEPIGTRVDGERIVDRRLLGGEIIRVGAIELWFQLLRRVPDQMLSQD